MPSPCSRMERGQLLEGGGVGAKKLVRLPREETPVVLWQPVAASLRIPVRVATVGGVANAPKLTGLRDRQRPQHHLLHQRKNSRWRAECEGDDGYGGKGGRLAQLAQAITQVLHQRPHTVSCLGRNEHVGINRIAGDMRQASSSDDSGRVVGNALVTEKPLGASWSRTAFREGSDVPNLRWDPPLRSMRLLFGLCNPKLPRK